jgi:hypothetical protein
MFNVHIWFHGAVFTMHQVEEVSRSSLAVGK